MHITVNTIVNESYVEFDYPLPADRDLNEALAEAKRLHPNWTSMVICITNLDGIDRTM